MSASNAKKDESIECPFCHEKDFDLRGLAGHVDDCEEKRRYEKELYDEFRGRYFPRMEAEHGA